MEKVCIALWRTADGPPTTAWADDVVLPFLSTAPDLCGATVHVESADPAHDAFRHGTGRSGQALTGLVSVWFDTYHDAAGLQEVVEGAAQGECASYLVCESVPQPYGDVLSWPEGEPSPGLSIVTLLDKPEGTEEAEFYRSWHELHRITTAQCHPFASYVRNEVARALTPGAPRYRGIVTEASPDVRDFLDPHRFYASGGDEEQLRANQRRVLDETSVFIDFGSIQVAPMVERVVRRLAPTSP